MNYNLNERYEVPESQTAAEFIGAMTQGRLAPIVLKLEFGAEGADIVQLLGQVDAGRDLISFERRRNGEFIRDFPCHRVTAVTLVNTEPPLDRSDELCG